MDKQEIQILVEKFIEQTASPAEEAQLMQWYRSANEQEIEWLSEHTDESERIRLEMLAVINRETGQTPVRRIRPFRWVAAVSILLILSAVGYFLIHQQAPVQVARIKPGTFKNDAVPGNKAILTLANGQQIAVAGLPVGHIQNSANTNIQKTADGTAYKMMANGDIKKAAPKVDVKREGNNVRLTINASDEDQYKQILKDIKKKNTGLDIDHALRIANRSEYYLDEPISLQMTMGGEDVFKSLTKTAINYYIHVGGESTYIKHLIPYLDGNITLGNVWFHYPDEKVYQSQDDEVSHVLRVIGDPEKRLLYAYIELFNAHNYIVLLNEWYDGDAVDGTYAYHLINNNEINITTNLDYSREHVLNLFSQKDAHPHVRINNCLNRSFKIADAVQTKFHLNKRINSAVHSALDKYPPGTKFSKEVIADLQREVQTQIVPFIAHQLRKRNK